MYVICFKIQFDKFEILKDPLHWFKEYRVKRKIKHRRCFC